MTEKAKTMIEMDWYNCPFGCDDDVLDTDVYKDPDTYYCFTCGYQFIIKRRKMRK